MSSDHKDHKKAKSAAVESKVQVKGSVAVLPDGSFKQEEPFIQTKKTIFGRLAVQPKLATAKAGAFTNKVPTAHEFPTETKTLGNGQSYQAIILLSKCIHDGCEASPLDAYSTFGCPYVPIDVDGDVSPRDAASPSGINAA